MTTTLQRRRRAPTTSSRQARWRAVLAREAAADGTFVFAVSTTGIYCRPSCGARRPHRANVRFFGTPAAAQQAGFRACKRCRPDAVSPARERTHLVAAVCRRIDDALADGAPLPRLRDLAGFAGLSPWHLQRMFRRTTGLTPHAYGTAVRSRQMRVALGVAPTVTAAVHAAGHESSARFYADAAANLGMAPRRFRAGGRGERIGFATAACRLGTVLVAATARGLCAILLGDSVAAVGAELRERFAHAELVAGDAAFRRTVARVVAFVDGDRASLGLPLDIRGTVFQQRVWQQLQRIPAGGTRSYADVARQLGRPTAARAVAKACAGNAHAVAIPCHRVVRSDGGVAGYRWGAARKQTLLERERRFSARQRR